MPELDFEMGFPRPEGQAQTKNRDRAYDNTEGPGWGPRLRFLPRRSC